MNMAMQNEQHASKRIRRNEFGSLELEEIQEDELENSSLGIKFEKQPDKKPNNPEDNLIAYGGMSDMIQKG